MSEKQLEQMVTRLGEQEDEAIAMRFVFMTLARLLNERAVLPLPLLCDRLAATAEQLRDGSLPGSPDDLSPAAAQVDSLRASLLLLG